MQESKLKVPHLIENQLCTSPPWEATPVKTIEISISENENNFDSIEKLKEEFLNYTDIFTDSGSSKNCKTSSVVLENEEMILLKYFNSNN